MNLCDTCRLCDNGCPAPGDNVPLCIEYQPHDLAACRAAQLWHASHLGAQHWQALLRMIAWATTHQEPRA